MAGLVTITPGSGFVTFGAAMLYGVLAGSLCNLAVGLIKDKFKLDDTLDVAACHGVGGLLGTILTAVFATKTVNPAGADGLFYGDFALMKAHIIASIAVILFSCIITFVLYKIVDGIFGMRVSENEERQGLDTTQHGEVVNSLTETSHGTANPPSNLKMAR